MSTLLKKPFIEEVVDGLDDGGDRLISVTFDGKKATIPVVKGIGNLMAYFAY